MNSLQNQIQRYEAFIKEDPKNTLIWVSVGDLYHRSGDFDKAQACFEKVLQLDPNDPIAHGRLANVAISQHDFRKAEDIIKTLPDHTQDKALLNNLGLALCHQEKWEEARDTLSKSFEQGVVAEELDYFKYLIYSYHHCDQMNEALEAVRAWYQMDNTTSTRGLISLIEMDLGDVDNARKHATEVLNDDAENTDAHTVIGYWQAEQQEIDEARRHFQKVIDANPNNERGWQGLGLAFMYDQNFDEARKCFLKYKAIDPDHVTNYVLLGWNEMAAQNPKDAEAYFRQAIDTDRTFGEAHGGLASALAMQFKLDEARGHIEKARGLDSEGFGATYAHSVSLHLQGKKEMGTKVFAKMLERTPEGSDKPLLENFRTFFRQQEAAKKNNLKYLRRDKKQ